MRNKSRSKTQFNPSLLMIRTTSIQPRLLKRWRSGQTNCSYSMKQRSRTLSSISFRMMTKSTENLMSFREQVLTGA